MNDVLLYSPQKFLRYLFKTNPNIDLINVNVMQGLKRKNHGCEKTFSDANAREPQELTCFEGALKYRCKVVLQGMGICLKRIYIYIYVVTYAYIYIYI